ncbi:MAG: class I SAM-dependent methyltransferase [Anaerolineales bacterium]
MRLLTGFIRLFFRHFYTTLAWSYDLVAEIVSVGQWNDWVRSVLDPFPNEPILEIAHGPGHLLLEIGQRHGNAIGIDASRQMCRIASHRLKRNGHEPRVVQAKAQALPFPEKSFATLISTFPTEFILDSSSLLEVRRTLQPRGQYRVVPMAEIRGPGFLDSMAAWLFRITGQYADIPPSWTDPFSDAGLNVHMEDVMLTRSRVIRLTATQEEEMEGQVV